MCGRPAAVYYRHRLIRQLAGRQFVVCSYCLEHDWRCGEQLPAAYARRLLAREEVAPRVSQDRAEARETSVRGKRLWARRRRAVERRFKTRINDDYGRGVNTVEHEHERRQADNRPDQNDPRDSRGVDVIMGSYLVRSRGVLFPYVSRPDLWSNGAAPVFGAREEAYRWPSQEAADRWIREEGGAFLELWAVPETAATALPYPHHREQGWRDGCARRSDLAASYIGRWELARAEIERRRGWIELGIWKGPDLAYHEGYLAGLRGDEWM